MNRLVLRLVALPVRRRLAQFEIATHDPRRVQLAVLRDILLHQRPTDFARDHGFRSIETVADSAASCRWPATITSSPTWPASAGAMCALCWPTATSTCRPDQRTTDTRKFIPVTDRYLETIAAAGTCGD